MDPEDHPSLVRLLTFARDATRGRPRPVTDMPSLRVRMDVSSGTFSNWKSRGISEPGALKAESLFGCSAHWLLTGRGPAMPTPIAKTGETPPTWTNAQHSNAGRGRRGLPVAHAVSDVSASDAPLLAWEDLMTKAVPDTFRVSLQDDSLAPELQRGDELVMDRTLSPLAGDIVLVRDQAGNHYARIYRERLHGAWVAHAPNEDFEPLDAKRDGITVVAVCTMELRRRRRGPA